MDTLYPIYYGTRLVTFDELRNVFEPHMHPEAAIRGFNFILHHGGKFGIGGGRRTSQPDAPGFAPAGKSFHQDQQFPSGLFYVAWDMVVVNPGYPHRAPLRDEVPTQYSQPAIDYGMHMNVGTPGTKGFEPWHMQPIELDGYDVWVRHGCQDLRYGYPIVISTPRPQPPQPPVSPALPPVTKGIIVQFASRNLVEGCIGPDVKFFQRQMNEIAGQGLIIDGDYGQKTTQAVKNWQTFFKLTVDGKLGAQTQKSIIEISLQAS
jgi:hypothetical protein